MNNPLDEDLDAFEVTKAALKVVRRVLEGHQNPVVNTSFHGCTLEEGREMLDKAEE
jgi:hypothetical protein